MACGGVWRQWAQRRIGVHTLRCDGLRQVREPRQGSSAHPVGLSVRAPCRCKCICPCSCHRAPSALVAVGVEPSPGY